MSDINQPKQTGINSITSTLNRGSVGDQVKALQQYLNGLGYKDVKADGIFGPMTEAAVKKWQLDNGLTSDGHFGPLSLGKAKTLGSTNITAGDPGSGKAPDDPSYMFRADAGKLNDKFVPKTKEEADKFYNTSALSHPVFAGNTPEALAYASSTGDFSGLSDTNGKPFSGADQADAVARANEALAPGFEATKQYDTQNTEADLAAKDAAYQKGLATDKSNFEADKTTLDQNAADKGVLFSGGRTEKEKKLQSTYSANDSYNRTTAGNGISNIARDYQYKYGNDAAAKPSLSQYYQLGGNTYNANVARGGVNSGGLSSIYNPALSSFQGTAVNANRSAAQARAAALLANKGNKLLSSGYNNQL